MHFDTQFRPEHGDMIFGLSATISRYAFPHHYRYVLCCIPMGPLPHISFVGRCNGMLGSAADPRSGIRYIVEYGLRRAGNITMDDESTMLAELHRRMGMSDADDPASMDPRLLYACVYLMDLFAHPKYSIVAPLIRNLAVRTSERNERFAPAWSVANSTWLATKHMSKFALEQLLKDKGIHWRGASPATVHFALDGLDMRRVVDKTDRSHAGGRPSGPVDMSMPGYTGSELRYLFRQREKLEGLVRFYLDKREVAAPWDTDPELWGCYVPRMAGPSR
ncbi:hypothetical protein EC912_105142 [Luteibacter rhizovicinus]|uniref:Uncharacterized protein n=1 Tax=Luteibacter rhizovicinus TaxID=242606 RepID=A0A4R3YM61_9GAMM|nr:hypothetical protein [Luteibacter rhizovicinus]TCV93282.1 hypothetical protein EC912_105142 [Luteibacter rhizovicinus]